jgi:hypothetical protein
VEKVSQCSPPGVGAEEGSASLWGHSAAIHAVRVCRYDLLVYSTVPWDGPCVTNGGVAQCDTKRGRTVYEWHTSEAVARLICCPTEATMKARGGIPAVPINRLTTGQQLVLVFGRWATQSGQTYLTGGMAEGA